MNEKRPSLIKLLGLFALILFLGFILSRVGLFKTSAVFGPQTGFWTVFFIGLVAASSSCIAVTGGLLLSSAAKFQETYGGTTRIQKLRPVLLFVGGRIASYGLLGGVIGLVGKALTPSPLMTGGLTILAAIYMFVMGLDMLGFAPMWLKRWMPRMPMFLGRKVIQAENNAHPAAPLLLGAATFFLPCGFTQALQLYALTTHSFWTSATLLFGFALGTAPALLGLGWASSNLKGKVGKFFFQFSGALVVVLGLWNIQNGFTMAGYPLTWPSFSQPQATYANTGDPNVTFDGGAQIMKMKINSGYDPNRFTIVAGLPTKWEIEAGEAAGCLSVIQSRALGIQSYLKPGKNVVEFTAPNQPGIYPFSCSMGMFRGQIQVVAANQQPTKCDPKITECLNKS